MARLGYGDGGYSLLLRSSNQSHNFAATLCRHPSPHRHRASLVPGAISFSSWKRFRYSVDCCLGQSKVFSDTLLAASSRNDIILTDGAVSKLEQAASDATLSASLIGLWLDDAPQLMLIYSFIVHTQSDERRRVVSGWRIDSGWQCCK